MNNPYQGEMNRPITRRERYVGREDAFQSLDSKVCSCVNTVVLGAEGFGKSNLLSCFFNREYCRRMARQEQILIKRLAYEAGLETQQVYTFFADAVRDAAQVLLEIGEEGAWQSIQQAADLYRTSSGTPAGYLQNICARVQDEGYFVVLVIDQFETFTSSSQVQAEHHNIMRNLVVNKQLSLVVATDYDFDKNSLPAGVAGSYLLQMFAGVDHTVELKGLSQEECARYLRQIAGEEHFTPEEVENLWLLSGGIPALLRKSACRALEQKRQGTLEEGWLQVKERAGEDCRLLMERWLRLLTPQEVELLEQLTAQVDRAEPIPLHLRDGAAPMLLSRGLIVPLGEPNCYEFNSLLLRDCCAAHPPQAGTPAPERERQKEGPVVVHIEHMSVDNSVHSEESVTNVGQMQVNQQNLCLGNGLEVSELLQLLSGPGDVRLALAERLHQHLSSLPALSQPAVRSDEEYDQLSSSIIADIGLDEEQELNISEEEEETLLQRFASARDRCRSELTDQLLERLGERCQFYVRLSVVVEDALTVLPASFQEDYSPQLVLYGKALEQALRDNLYELFHREETLSEYDTYSHRANPSSPKNFRRRRAGRVYIGDFVHLIDGMSGHLGRLCAGAGLEGRDQESWSLWWVGLQRDINKARQIRNLSDHADARSPGRENLDGMCALLFGAGEEQGVLERSLVGETLYRALFSPEPPPGLAGVPAAGGKGILGSGGRG